ncbi:MAG: prolipoprotein diacylglyceryl transferase [bacterium]
MYPILTNLGPLTIHSYGLMVALGYLVGILLILFYAKREGIPPETILDLAIWVIISGVVGARLFYVLGQWGEYRNNPLEIFTIQKGGLVFLGGFLANLLVLLVGTKLKKISWLKLFDAIAPGAAMGIAIGRIGCFLNGCCFGLPTQLPWGIKFPFGSLAYSYYPHDHIHPTQLYSSLAMLLVLLIIVFVIYPRKKYDGFVFYWWLIGYSLYRFSVEFLRYSPMHWLSLTPSQWIVIAFFGYGAVMLFKKGKGRGTGDSAGSRIGGGGI